MSSISTESVRIRTDHASSLAVIDPTWWRLAAVWILIVTALLRFYDLDLNPLHHDEGVNGFFLTNLVRSSTAYRYDPANYHGPALYYFARVSVALFGLTTAAIRVVPAIFGTLTVAFMLAWRSKIGGAGSLAAAALVACSPGAVYMSRYFIHEALLVWFMVAAVFEFIRYIEAGRAVDLVLAATALALMFATKETAIIAVGVLAVAFMVAGLATRHVERAAFGADRRAIGTSRRILQGAAALIVFAGIVVLFFSSFLAHPEAVGDALKGFAPWAHTGTAAHVHPWWTYLGWMGQEEAFILILGAVGALTAILRRDDAFAVFAAFWATGMLVAYSLVPYKTPWLTLNLIPPFALVAGYAIDRAWLIAGRRGRRMLIAAAAAAYLTMFVQTFNLNFVHYDDPAYPYVYVHTQRDLLRLVRDVEAVARSRAPASGRFHITVTSPQQFPLSWYLRRFDVGYYDHVIPSSDDVIVGSEQQDERLASEFAHSHERKGDYALRPGVRLVLYVRR